MINYKTTSTRKGTSQTHQIASPSHFLTRFSKTPEEVIYKRSMHHLKSNGILLSNEQFGFRRIQSTNKATYRPTLKILHAFDNKRDVADIFLMLLKPLTVLIPPYK
jgi:hypothetical protein